MAFESPGDKLGLSVGLRGKYNYPTMELDFFLVLRWWGTLFLVGAVAFPLTKALFGRATRSLGEGWYDSGYLFAKAVGMATITFLVYLLARIHLIPFTEWSIVVAMVVVFVGGIVLQARTPWTKRVGRTNTTFWHGMLARTAVIISLEELFFFAALLFWAWVKGHEPSIHGLEKFMDYGFTKAILNSVFLPAVDMWYPPHPINYYYFGHTVLAVLTRLSGIDLAYTFNIMLATLFALTATMSFSIGAQLFFIRHSGESRNLSTGSRIKSGMTAVGAGLLTSFLVTLAGNMQTIYAFTQGYSGDDVKPFWQLLWPMGELWQKLSVGMQSYWYANATRFIPFTIHEFPSYSFVVSDLHGHVLSLPFVLLAIALLIVMSLRGAEGDAAISTKSEYRLQRPLKGLAMTHLVFYGFLCGVLLMTNALDGPIYAGLFVILFIIQHSSFSIQDGKWWFAKARGIGIVAAAALLASLPFLTHFESFVTGIGVNCPPAVLENTKVALFLFEGAEKCQHSPLWMMWLLWGFFWFTGGWFIVSRFKIQDLRFRNRAKILQVFSKFTQLDVLVSVFFIYSLLLIIFPEFFYFKDIYPQHFRSNTMFKLGYQAFIMFSIVAGYSVTQKVIQLGGRARARIAAIVFFLLLAPQLFLVSIYPLFSVRSYFNSLKTYEGLDGLAWILRQYPNDYAGIQWLNSQASTLRHFDASTLLEADGDSYTDYARYSAFTGFPTVIGWPVHEWLWRGSYDVVAPRREDVRVLYESEDMVQTSELLARYGIRYVVVGTLERQKFTNLNEEKFMFLGSPVFTQGDTTIYIMKE